MYTQYYELIKRRYMSGKIEYERYRFLIGKLIHWYYGIREREDG